MRRFASVPSAEKLEWTRTGEKDERAKPGKREKGAGVKKQSSSVIVRTGMGRATRHIMEPEWHRGDKERKPETCFFI